MLENTMDDGPSITELVEQHYALVYRYAFRLSGSASDAEDLTQETYLTAQTKLDQLREPRNAKAWLCAIARNSFLKKLRDHDGHPDVSLENVTEPPDKMLAESPIDCEELQAVLNELPETYRTPLILFYFEEFSYKEIAQQMEMPIGTVMSRLARAKSYLRRRLSSREPAMTKP